MTIATFTMPWPPSLNHYKQVGSLTRKKTGRIYQRRVNTIETKEFYWNAYQEIKRRIGREGTWQLNRAEISLGVQVDLYPPSKRLYDLDNRLKCLLDSLVKFKAINDDSQITRLLVQKMPPFPNGKAVVTIYEILEGAPCNDSRTGTEKEP